ncbi:MAG: HIT domain-containing protein [Chlamydiales bacterium]
MAFELHSNFAKKIFLADLPLSKVLMENERHYPWLMLIPRRSQVSRLIDLNLEDQTQLLHEMNFIQQVLWKIFQPTQLNVAAIGNKTPQLHIHIIARFENDPAWPGTVWDHPTREPLSPEQLKDRQVALQEILQSEFELLTQA